MRRTRLTTRRTMALVALAGLVLGVAAWMERRAERFRKLALDHMVEWIGHASPQGDRGRAAYHWTQGAKYRRAARYPWLPVEPDPPELEDVR